jgi:hypothetical protein
MCGWQKKDESMSTRIVTEPTVEPLTLAEVKTHLHEDLSDASNDALITTLIAVARQACRAPHPARPDAADARADA